MMQMVAPAGPVYQAGTLSGNPLAMEMGIRQLTYLRDHKEVYTYIKDYAKRLADALRDIISEYHLPCCVNQCGSLLTLFFKEGKVENYDDVMKSDLKKFTQYYKIMSEQGMMLAPSQFEGIFVNYAHTQEDFDKTITAMKMALLEVFQ